MYSFFLIAEQAVSPELSGITKRIRYMFQPFKQWPGYHRAGGVADRYRFFHVGLGKRDHMSDSTTLHDKDVEPVRPISVNPIQVPASTSRADPLIKAAIFKHFHLDNPDIDEQKRSPEVFSESLYPLQSGKQALEAMLDKTLNFPTYGDADMFDDDIHFDNTFAEEIGLSDIDDNPLTAREQFLTSPSGSITSPSGDGANEQLTNTKSIDSSSDNESSELPTPVKRWWAARALKHFRSPKSSRLRTYGPRRQIDPVLYFIGLGR